MKKYLLIITFNFSLLALHSKADYWTQKADIPGAPSRNRAFGFSIGNKGYVVGGLSTSFHYDLWEYDPVLNSWTQKANYPGNCGWEGSGFVIGSKAYFGAGSFTISYFNDFWEYDPNADAWTQKANHPVGGGGVCGFTIGSKGYLGTGYYFQLPNSYWYFKQFYEFDPVANIWIQKQDYGGMNVAYGAAFAIGNKGYMGTGNAGTGNYVNDFWEYDPIADSWTQKANLAGGARKSAVAFSIGTKGYIGTGEDPGLGIVYQDFWEYDPLNNGWIQKANYGGVARTGAVGFSIGTKGYIGAGVQSGPFIQDFWEYTPDSTTGIDEFQVSGFEFQVSPNPAKDFIVISYPLNGKEKITVTITDVNGKKVYETKLLTSDFRLPTSGFQEGIYFVELSNGKQKAVKKFVKE